MTLRRTKIISTLGPATDKPGVLEKLLLAGANVVRLNFSHGTAEDHAERVRQVREISEKHNLNVALLGDLQGPKIRISKFKEGGVELAVGDEFILDADLDSNAGDQEAVGVDYKALPEDVGAGDRLLLDDGRIVLQVKRVEGSRVCCDVEIGGYLSNNKGINRDGGGLSAEALTEKDKRDIKIAADLDLDYLAVSFPRYAKDINHARRLAEEAGCNVGIVAKIERAESVADVETLEELISASDVVMVARGDLGVEIGDAQLIAKQKDIIARARRLNRVVITATQMMESMITNPMPTRAEVFDVANAVLDGTDAVMLSGESAAGKYPVEAVEAMVRIILGAEKQPQLRKSSHRIDREFHAVDESVAMASMYVANHLKNVKSIISMTESGNTPLLMSRIRSGMPIFAFTPHAKSQRRMAMYRGVQAVCIKTEGLTVRQIDQSTIKYLKGLEVVELGDLVIISKGNKVNTNTMKILPVT